MVSAIGGAPDRRPEIGGAGRKPASLASRLLIDSTAQGLVRFDASGQIEPGLAERWIVMDGGLSYIFRLREGSWSDGRAVTADQVIAILTREIGRDSNNPLAPFLTAIDEVVVMTPQVIEVRLSRARPDLLKLFAQPELALLRLRSASGSGPFRVVGGTRSPLLRPAFDPNKADPDDQREPKPQEEVRLIGERAARAVARFANRDSDLVSGGTFADWPLLAYADVPPASVRIDPAAGLFGLVIVNRDGFLSDALNRTAIAEAIDRSALTAAVAPNWEPTDRILPEPLDSIALPQVPGWVTLTLGERQTEARQRVAAWSRGSVRLRIALPTGPGATRLYAQLALAMFRIGITPVRVAPNDAADLKLIDAVAPYDSARWYLATACVLCGDAARTALEAARQAPTLAERGQRLAEADRAMNEDVAFIPLARPYRWSLVAARLRQWQPNTRAWHPLNRLRADTN